MNLSLNIYRGSYINSIEPLCCPFRLPELRSDRRERAPRKELAGAREGQGGEGGRPPRAPPRSRDQAGRADRQPNFLPIPAAGSEGLPIQEPTVPTLHQPALSPCSCFPLKAPKQSPQIGFSSQSWSLQNTSVAKISKVFKLHF